MSTPESPADLRISTVLLPVAEGWKAMLGAMLVAGALTAALVMSRPRSYLASATLSTVAGGRGGLAGSLSSVSPLLGVNAGGGLQATPQFIRVLVQQDGVLERVARAPVGEGARRSVIDSLAAVTGGTIESRDATAVLRGIVGAGVDKETGIITISAQLSDSALARRLVDVTVQEVSTTFARVARAQATELRDALTGRVDSARRQLDRAEEAYRDFQSANRAFEQYSLAAIQRQRLERAVNLAQVVYTQAVTERETAVGKALEEAPAVVVVDPVPTHVPRVGRGTVLKSAAAALFAGVIAALVLLVRAPASDAPMDRAEERERWRRALRSIPLLGRPLARLLVPDVDAARGARPSRDGSDDSSRRVA